MDALSLDHFEVFVAVVEAGSFSAAARQLNRAPSAVTYAIQRLEEQVGSPLFDRNAYRPILSDPGRVLLPQARRILDDVGRFRASARRITRGLETEVRVLVSATIPMALLAPALAGFRDAFPDVQLRVSVLPFTMGTGRTEGGLIPGRADIRIFYDMLRPDSFVSYRIGEMTLIRVAGRSHPLANPATDIDEDSLRPHLQIVLSEPQEYVPGEDHRVLAVNTWRVTDPQAQHDLIKAGLGWGSVLDAAVTQDLASGALVNLDSRTRHGPSLPHFTIVAGHLRDEPPGPASEWLLDRLSAPMQAPSA